jgi:hypothetical protein
LIRLFVEGDRRFHDDGLRAHNDHVPRSWGQLR